MPPLVANGPDLPPVLLQAQADGDLVLFCGAGVSVPNGLPTFKGLVEEIYDRLGEAQTSQEQLLFKRGQFDYVLGSLESRVGHRLREEVCKRLLETRASRRSLHAALLDLATHRDGCRLVTTNFDPLFVRRRRKGRHEFAVQAAPALPVPRRHRWNSLAHLHGLVDRADPRGQTLVLTASDFGLAYLVDGWATRFVAELLRNFTVLFVGYRVDDPVMRYLTDAVAVEQAHGVGFKSAYALAPIEKGTAEGREDERREWRSKGLTAIPYDAHGAAGDHHLLTETILAWAELHRGGFLTRRNWVERLAGSPPSDPNSDDAKLMRWALSERSGAVARHFAELDPAPPLSWLPVLELPLPELGASLLALPAYREGHRWEKGHPLEVRLVDAGWSTSGPQPLAPVTSALGYWLVRHLSSPDLSGWALRQGGRLHPKFRRKIRSELSRRPEIPEPLRRVWRLLTSEALAGAWVAEDSLWELEKRLETEPWSSLLQAELLAAARLVPRLGLPSQLYQHLKQMARVKGEPEGPLEIRDLTEVELAFAGGKQVKALFGALSRNTKGAEIRARMADELTSLVARALSSLEDLDAATNEHDPSRSALPSLADHPQNRFHDDLAIVLVSLRDSFAELVLQDPAGARRLLDCWLSLPFPAFRRLALHAITESSSLPVSLATTLLSSKPIETLWSLACHREVLRFLRETGARLGRRDLSQLVRAILEGPPRSLFRADLEQPDWIRIKDETIWKRLAKLHQSGVQVPRRAEAVMKRLAARHGLRLQADHRDEFISWFESGSGGGASNFSGFAVLAPGELARAAEGLNTDAQQTGWFDLAKRRPLRTLAALKRVARDSRWPGLAWNLAFRGLNSRTPTRRSLYLWQAYARCAAAAPPAPLAEVCAVGVAWLFDQTSQLPKEHEKYFWPLWDAWYGPALAEGRDIDREVVNAALNHPAGQLARVLLYRLWARRPQRGEGLPEEVRSRLIKLMESEDPGAHLARVILAADLDPLYEMDPAWTESHLLPRLDWSSSPEAASLWLAYLWHPTPDPSLLAVIKQGFLTSLGRLSELEPARENACRLFAFSALETPAAYRSQEVQQALRELAPGDLASVGEAIVDLLQGAEGKAPDLWRETIGPWVAKHWPSRVQLETPEVAQELGRAALAAGDAFPEAFQGVRQHLVPVPSPWGLESELVASSHPEDFPEEVLEFVSVVVPSEADPPLGWHKLRTILERIAAAKPDLRLDVRYLRLEETLARADR